MIVVDASTAVSALLNGGPARHALAEEHVHVPHLIDSEVASALRRRVLAGQISAEHGRSPLETWRRRGALDPQHSNAGVIEAVAHPEEGLRRGLVSMAFGFGGPPERDPDLLAVGSSVSRLVPDDVGIDAFSGQPRMSNVPVSVKRVH